MPQLSVAVQVRVYFLAHGSLRSSVSTGVTTGAASQRSLTVGSSNSGVAGHSTVLSATQSIFGAVVSTTVIVCEQLAALPQLSVAVQVRVYFFAHGSLRSSVFDLESPPGPRHRGR